MSPHGSYGPRTTPTVAMVPLPPNMVIIVLSTILHGIFYPQAILHDSYGSHNAYPSHMVAMVF